jgi:hypothetical protein
MEKERLVYSITRFDHYFDSVNNKTAGYIALKDHICKYSNLFNSLLSLEMIIGVLNLIFLIFASVPYFTKNSKSLYYFGGIGSFTEDEFTKRSKSITGKEELKDLRNQVHVLSLGLTKKFSWLKKSGRLLVLQFFLLLPLIIILLLNKF